MCVPCVCTVHSYSELLFCFFFVFFSSQYAKFCNYDTTVSGHMKEGGWGGGGGTINWSARRHHHVLQL